MDVKQMRYFVGVLRARSITKAAQQLHVAQPALGLQIRKLEEELGVDLFVRHSRGVTPTEAGTLLAKHATLLLSQFERARQDLLDHARRPHGRVVVGMTPTSSLVLAAALAERCRSTYPEVSLTITEGLSERLMEWVESDQIDVTLTYNPDAVKGLVCKPLIVEALFFVWRRDNDKADGGPVPFAEVLRSEMVVPSRTHLLRTLIDDVAEISNASLKVAFEVDSVPAIKDMVRRGLGATILPYGAVRAEVEEGKFHARRIDDARLHRTMYLAYSNTRLPSKAIIAISQLIEETVHDLAASGSVGWWIGEGGAKAVARA